MANENHHAKSNGSHLHKQLKGIMDQLQKEIKRLHANPKEAGADPTLYHSLADQIHTLDQEVPNQDMISALNTASENLKKAALLAEKHAPTHDILSHLQTANSELFKIKNMRM